jgi:hypothetical protein
VKKLLPLVALICLLSTFAATKPATKPTTELATEFPDEVLHFDLGAGWHDVNHTETGKRQTITFLREGDQLAHWKERVTYTYGPKLRGFLSPQKEAEEIKRYTAKTFRQDLVAFNIISADDSIVLYEWNTKWSAQTHEQHDLTRILQGQHNWFDLSYVSRKSDYDLATRAWWIKTLTDATIKTAQP